MLNTLTQSMKCVDGNDDFNVEILNLLELLIEEDFRQKGLAKQNKSPPE